MNFITLSIALLITFVTYAAAVLWGDHSGAALALLALAVMFVACIMISGIVERGGLLRVLFGVYFILGYIFPGMLHAASGAYPYFGITYDEETVFTASLIVVIFAAFALLGSTLASLRPHRQFPVEQDALVPQMRVGAIVGLCAMTMVLVLLIGPSAFIRRRSDEFMTGVGSFETLLILMSIARSLPVLAVCASLHRRWCGGWSLTNIALFSLSLICVSVTNFPLAVPRFALVGVVVTVLHFAVDISAPRFKFLFVASVVAGIVTVFPLLSFLQRGVEGTAFEINPLSYLAISVDLDGFQSTANIVQVVDANKLYWGWQLLSSAFFWVPRSIWPDKGQPSGAIGADYVGYPFNNISAPLPSELYIDFGFVGCMIGGLLVGYLITRLDRSFLHSLPRLRYHLLIGSIAGFEVILARGPLLGVIGPVIAQLSLFFVSTTFPFLSATKLNNFRSTRPETAIKQSPTRRRISARR